jgi:hypothetical protein
MYSTLLNCTVLYGIYGPSPSHPCHMVNKMYYTRYFNDVPLNLVRCGVINLNLTQRSLEFGFEIYGMVFPVT